MVLDWYERVWFQHDGAPPHKAEEARTVRYPHDYIPRYTFIPHKSNQNIAPSKTRNRIQNPTNQITGLELALATTKRVTEPSRHKHLHGQNKCHKIVNTSSWVGKRVAVIHKDRIDTTLLYLAAPPPFRGASAHARVFKKHLAIDTG
ncbi:hypothetical protein CEXT_350721 [Caerostris extrusa]|uniref:Transposase n=1 Tax=Caerostris extrusa TaxID=172846 RepID=A0AAV4VWL5_CAEEX|nr:hypothetical protein CEXT_350721 [Caerostris extrusa]